MLLPQRYCDERRLLLVLQDQFQVSISMDHISVVTPGKHFFLLLFKNYLETLYLWHWSLVASVHHCTEHHLSHRHHAVSSGCALSRIEVPTVSLKRILKSSSPRASWLLCASLEVSHTSNLGVESDSNSAVRVVCSGCHFSSTTGPMPASRTDTVSKVRYSILTSSGHSLPKRWRKCPALGVSRTSYPSSTQLDYGKRVSTSSCDFELYSERIIFDISLS